MRARRRLDIWPGFVDAIASLLMVVVFVLLMATIGQFFLSDIISDKDDTLSRLDAQVAKLEAMLGRAEDRADSLSGDLQQTRQALSEREQELTAERMALSESRQELATTQTALDSATAAVASLTGDKARLQARRDELSASLAQMQTESEEARAALNEAQSLSEQQAATITQLNERLARIQEELARISAALDVSEAELAERDEEIANLEQRLKVAMADRINQLKQYRSEFFGRLRSALSDQPDIRVVGDRFVLPSSLLFASGSAELGDRGREQVQRLAATLKDVSAQIPEDLDWVVRIDGHTDTRPISTSAYPSNWELSTARALTIVKTLIDFGIPPSRLAATGFGEYHPIASGSDADTLARNRRIEIKLTSR